MRIPDMRKLSDRQRPCTLPHPGSRTRAGISPGMIVRIELKKDQGTGRLTEGRVKEILTGSRHHPHGIKVRLEDGSVGRVQQIG
jgi:uncharacterized repeat protein (TIGR03833 family)